MIIDCFTFFNELDLLEIRLNELKDVVDIFVLTESPYTFTGIKKPLYFQNNKGHFRDFNIEHTIYVPNREYRPEVYEKRQKQFNIDSAFKVWKPGDIILQGDVDEIPRASTIKEAIKHEWKSAGLNMDTFYYYLNCKGTMRRRKLRGDARLLRPDGWFEYNAKQDDVDDVIYNNGGWHFGFLGDVQAKIAAWGHANQYNKPPYNTKEHIEKCMEEGLDLFMRKGRRSVSFEFIYDLTYLPLYVLQNMDKFSKYIKWIQP